jgi:two-component system, OmpR family, sensor histidine kinase MtrB
VRGHKVTTSPLPLKPPGKDRAPRTSTRAPEPAGERA